MKIIPVEKADLSLSALAELAKTGAVILTRKGKPLAAVNDLSDADWESVALANNPQFQALIAKSRQSAKDEGVTAAADVRRELGLRKASPRRRPKKT